MKTIRNILAALLLILFVWANAKAGVTYTPRTEIATIENIDKPNVDVYVSNGILNLTFDRIPTEKIHVEIFDITGKRIDHSWLPAEQSKAREMELNNRLKRGLYIVKVSHGKHVHAIKIQN